MSLGDQRGAGEGYAGGIGERLEQIVPHVGPLCAVRLVHHDEDARGIVDDAKSLGAGRRGIAPQLFAQAAGQVALRLDELVDHHHVHVGGGRGEHVAHGGAAVDQVKLLRPDIAPAVEVFGW